MKIIEGGITSPQGFLANGIASGIKKRKKDMAVLVSKNPAQAAGAFTTNKVKAAPVIWDKQLIDGGKSMSAIVINSGNANACTGERGLYDTKSMAALAAEILSESGTEITADQVLVCSTGVIGVPLPMDTVKKRNQNLYRVAFKRRRSGSFCGRCNLHNRYVPQRDCSRN